MKNKTKILAVCLGLVMTSGLAIAQLTGIVRFNESHWYVGDRKIQFGDTPNAQISYTGGNLVLDILSGGGKVSIPDGVEFGASNIALSESLVFEGATADAFETTLSVVDPTADRTVSFPNVSGTTLLSVAAQDAATSVKGVANGLEFEGATANAHETTITVTDATADRTITIPDSSGTVVLTGSSAAGTIGWSMVAGANTACTTTCTSDCVFGFDAAGAVIVDCADATADRCICAGSN
jgi:hypothetical protein